ncbi:MAG: GtrA family protein [Paludibacter sp.]|nr:GtrA family protein [Paludibacter sp.]
MKNSTLYKRLYDSGLIKFIKYGLVGVLGLVVDMGVFYLLNKKLGVNYVVANITSSSLAIIHNFILNSYFTFKITDNKLKRFATFYLIALIGMAVSSGLLVVFIDGLKLDTMVSKLITVFIVAIGQFIFNKKLTFRKNKK